MPSVVPKHFESKTKYDINSTNCKKVQRVQATITFRHVRVEQTVHKRIIIIIMITIKTKNLKHTYIVHTHMQT
jgi:hypothetical protein